MFGVFGLRPGGAQPQEPPRVKRQPKFHGELNEEKKSPVEPDVSELRRARLDKLEGRTASKSARTSAAIPKPTIESNATTERYTSATDDRRRRHRDRAPSEDRTTRHRSRSKTVVKEEKSAGTYVYGDPKSRDKSRAIPVKETRRRDEEDESSDSETERESRRRTVDTKTKKKGTTSREEPRTSSSKTRVKTEEKLPSKRSADIPPPLSRRATQRTQKSGSDSVSRPPLSRSATVRIPPPVPEPLVRRNSISSTTPSKQKAPSSVAETTASQEAQKPRGFLSSFFAAAPAAPAVAPAEPEKLVKCITCLSDDVPKSKCPKLACSHRMCQSCLKRIFKLSVKDPQHMPPKCCTTEHIPLKHVEKLFDVNFKKLWNKKYQEYTTKNRIYCPGKRCGEWIKPANIHTENGKKYGLCVRCKTKVCCQCNSKWHGSKDCPKDEETKRLLETAKLAGWQRCYSCRTMVELKEGCNHMTCRCTAQFCMICGLKWKSCNCPWFNYDGMEEDRLNNMRVPEPVQEPRNPEPRNPQPRNPPPQNPDPQPTRIRRRSTNHTEEMNDRRRQGRRDSETAQRMQNLDIDPDDEVNPGGIGDIHAVGNASGHFMNQDYIRGASNILTQPFSFGLAAANFVIGGGRARPSGEGAAAGMAERYPTVQPAAGANSSAGRGATQQAPPLARRHSTREPTGQPSRSRRASEILVPRRSRTYEAEAAIHAPVSRSSGSRSSKGGPPSPSILAGLGATDRGNGGRVNAWRTYVSPGAPSERVA
ncbi:Zinc finger C6HC-type protein [Rutstroemia sp. NJR-2017a BVV2]|nr:Zinc finger C6HC-type protein [Rutstroemia sp. NJR-2017a BVV2]